MLRPILLLFLALVAAPAATQETAAPVEALPQEIILPGDSVDLNEFLWTKRPLIVFADSPSDPRYAQQMAFLTAGLNDLADRDVVVLTDTARGEDTALRRKLHPRGFMLVLIGKDGNIYLRKPLPWNVREIGRVIDKLPMRQQEIRDRLGES